MKKFSVFQCEAKERQQNFWKCCYNSSTTPKKQSLPKESTKNFLPPNCYAVPSIWFHDATPSIVFARTDLKNREKNEWKWTELLDTGVKRGACSRTLWINKVYLRKKKKKKIKNLFIFKKTRKNNNCACGFGICSCKTGAWHIFERERKL